MSKSDNIDGYRIKEVYINSANYNLLILKVPVEEIEDKLTHLSHERGLIAKSLYYDFLIGTCVAKIESFLQHLKQLNVDLDKLNKIRDEVIARILEINKNFDPHNLIINKNHVIKMKPKGNKKSDKDAILLVENEFWNTDIYSKANKSNEDENKDGKTGLNKDNIIQNIQDLTYTTTQKFWKRIQQYVTIKQFNEEDATRLVGNMSFTTRSAFEQYVVTICVEEIDDLFFKLDKLGLPKRVPPLMLITELYELCKICNPFLDYKLYKNDNYIDENEDIDNPFSNFHRTAGFDSEEDYEVKKAFKLFKHIKRESLLDLDSRMKEKVIGQNKAIDSLVDAIQRASVGLRDPNQPIGSFVFTGYSGCGKTYTAKMLAEELIGDEKGIIIVDCSEYSADHEYAKLIGAPMGYIGHEQGGYLTNAVKKRPFSIVLFDEIEKASEKVHQLLLQIMEEARLTDGKGKHISFKDTIIIMTSNLGIDEVQSISKTIGFGDVKDITPQKHEKAVKKSLKSKFKPEFLNRITSFIDFESLNKDSYLKIIDLELNKLRKYLKLNNTMYSNIELDFDKSLFEFIYNKGIDEKLGARPLKRIIEREISTSLARKLLSETIKENSKAKIYIENNEIKINMVPNINIYDPPFYMELNKSEELNE